MSQFPGFGIFPGNINRVVKMQQQSLVSVEKSQPQKIVVYKCEPGPNRNINYAESGWSLGHNHLRAQRRVAIHVFDVVGNSRVRMVQNRPSLQRGRTSAHLDSLMHSPILDTATASTKQSQLRIRPETAVPHPST